MFKGHNCLGFVRLGLLGLDMVLVVDICIDRQTFNIYICHENHESMPTDMLSMRA